MHEEGRRFRLTVRGRLGRRFFDRPALELAPDLLGRFLVSHRDGEIDLAVRIVEVEAYLGVGQDPASHAYRGQTARNAEMFASPGRLYVYFCYGMHHCLNVVCDQPGQASAILLRAAEPLAGAADMEQRRGRKGFELTNGPAKLCQAMGVDLSWNGTDLVGGPLGLWAGEPPRRISRSRRIGIRRGIDRLYRWFDADSDYVSRTKPAQLT